MWFFQLVVALLLIGASNGQSTNHCTSSSVQSLNQTRFIDNNNAIIFNQSTNDVDSCRIQCCNIAGCIAYSFDLKPQSLDDSTVRYQCYIHQSINGWIQSNNFVGGFVDIRYREQSSNQTIKLIDNGMLQDAINLPANLKSNQTWESKSPEDCAQKCSNAIGCLGAIWRNEQTIKQSTTRRSPASQLNSYIASKATCVPYAFFSNVVKQTASSNQSINQTVVLCGMSAPRVTPVRSNDHHSISENDHSISESNQQRNTPSFYPDVPVRGWSTYDSYGSVPDESTLMENVENIVKYLNPSTDISFIEQSINQSNYGGYRLISLDWGWWESLTGQTTLDERGRYQPSADRFPSSSNGHGLKSFSDALHSRGLLLGLYTDAGISVAFNNTPGSPNYVPTREQCPWSGNTWFLDWSNPAAQEWLDGVVEQWAQWGVDYVKVDCIGSITGYQQVLMYAQAIAQSSNPSMILSISPGYNGDVRQERVIANSVNQFRVAVDFHDLWDVPVEPFYPSLVQMIDYAVMHEIALAGLPIISHAMSSVIGSSGNQQTVRGSSFPDMDALPFGMIMSWSNGHSSDPQLMWSGFNKTQQQTNFAIWCIYRSPLVFGGRMDDQSINQTSIDIVMNPHLLHIHSYGGPTESEWIDHTWLITKSSRVDLKQAYMLIANINSTELFEVSIHLHNPPYVKDGLSVKCDIVEAWSGQRSHSDSFKAMLGYSESVVLIFSNCDSSVTPLVQVSHYINLQNGRTQKYVYE